MSNTKPALLADGTTVENWKTCDWKSFPRSPAEMVDALRESGLDRDEVSLFCYTGRPCQSGACGFVVPRYGKIYADDSGGSDCSVCQNARTANGPYTKENWSSFSLEEKRARVRREYDDLMLAAELDDRMVPPTKEEIDEEETVMFRRRKRKAAEAKRFAQYLYAEQGGHCAGCLRIFFQRNLEVDHIVPWSKGGTNQPENLQLLCPACNSLKGAETPGCFAERLLAEAKQEDSVDDAEWGAALEARGTFGPWAKKGWA